MVSLAEEVAGMQKLENVSLSSLAHGLSLSSLSYSQPSPPKQITAPVTLQRGSHKPTADIAAVVQDLGWMKQEFGTVEMKRMGRSANTVAHTIAQHAQKMDRMEIWLEEPPDWMKHALAPDWA